MRFAFSPTALLELDSSLIEGAGRKICRLFSRRKERAKINFFALQAPHVRGAVAPVGCGKTVLSLSAAPNRIKKKRVAEAFEDVMLFFTLGNQNHYAPGINGQVQRQNIEHILVQSFFA